MKNRENFLEREVLEREYIKYLLAFKVSKYPFFFFLIPCSLMFLLQIQSVSLIITTKKSFNFLFPVSIAVFRLNYQTVSLFFILTSSLIEKKMVVFENPREKFRSASIGFFL